MDWHLFWKSQVTSFLTMNFLLITLRDWLARLDAIALQNPALFSRITSLWEQLMAPHMHTHMEGEKERFEPKEIIINSWFMHNICNTMSLRFKAISGLGIRKMWIGKLVPNQLVYSTKSNRLYNPYIQDNPRSVVQVLAHLSQLVQVFSHLFAQESDSIDTSSAQNKKRKKGLDQCPLAPNPCDGFEPALLASSH